MPNGIQGTSLALQKRGFGDYVVGPAREAGRPNFSSRGSLLKSSPYLKKEIFLTDWRSVSCALRVTDRVLALEEAGFLGAPFTPAPSLLSRLRLLVFSGFWSGCCQASCTCSFLSLSPSQLEPLETIIILSFWTESKPCVYVVTGLFFNEVASF